MQMEKTKPAETAQNTTDDTLELARLVNAIRKDALRAGMEGRPAPVIDWSEDERWEPFSAVVKFHAAIDHLISVSYNHGKEIASEGRRQANG